MADALRLGDLRHDVLTAAMRLCVARLENKHPAVGFDFGELDDAATALAAELAKDRPDDMLHAITGDWTKVAPGLHVRGRHMPNEEDVETPFILQVRRDPAGG